MKLKLNNINPVNKVIDKKLILTKSEQVNEADVNRGKRLLAIEEIKNKVSSAVSSSNGFKVKFDSDKGFIIYSKKDYLFRVNGSIDNEKNITISLLDNSDKEIKSVNVKNTLAVATLSEELDKLLTSAISKIISSDKFKLNEFYNPITDFIDKLKAKKDIKDEQDKANDEFSAFVKETLDKALSDIKETAKEKYPHNSLDINSKNSSDSFNIDINSDYVIKILFETDFKDLTDIKVNKIVTPLDVINVDENDKLANINNVLDLLNKNLDLNIKDLDIKNDEENKDVNQNQDQNNDQEKSDEKDQDKEQSNKKQSQKSDYEINLLDRLGDEVKAIFEKLQESVLKVNGLDIKKFDLALTKIDSDKLLDLVKLFMFKATGLDESKLSDSSLQLICDNIREVRSFNFGTNNYLAVIVNYARKYKELDQNIVDTILDMDRNIINKEVDRKDSIIYLKSIYNYNDNLDLFLEKYFSFIDRFGKTGIINNNERLMIVRKVVGRDLRITNIDQITKFDTLVKWIFFKDKDRKSLRSISEINNIISDINKELKISNNIYIDDDINLDVSKLSDSDIKNMKINDILSVINAEYKNSDDKSAFIKSIIDLIKKAPQN